MSQRFEDNIIKAVTTSDIVLLKNTLESSEKIIGWNQTIDGLSVLALCVRFFDSEIIQTLYPPSDNTLPDDIFTYIIERAPKNVVEVFASNIVETINAKLTHRGIWNDYSDAEQVLHILQKSTQHVKSLINSDACNLINVLLNSEIDPNVLSLLLIKSIEWESPQLVNHVIQRIGTMDRDNWCDLSYKDWNTDHIQYVCRIYAEQSNPNLNVFLDQLSPQTWNSAQQAHHCVLLYSTDALKDLLNASCQEKTKRFLQNAPQRVLQRLSDENILKQFSAHELEMLLNVGPGCAIEQYGFLSNTPISFEIPLILEQYRRIYFSPKDVPWRQKPEKEWRRFQRFCAPLLSSIPYAFQEKRMDLEMYYKFIHGTSPNQSVSVLDCLKAQDRAWTEKILLYEQINDSSFRSMKKI